jgi:hypothetical protein
VFEADKASEDTDAAFFDADSDGDQDLYVASGGYEFPSSSTALISRLYFNDGKGNLTRSDQILPAGKFESSSCVRPADFDKDGVTELFVGIRLVPFEYGVPASSYLLENDGQGHFQNVTDKIAPDLKNVGMVKDMIWSDVDNDGDPDMIIVGEWMPVTLLINENNTFVNATRPSGLDSTHGWWNRIKASDFNRDGFPDFIIGNHGWNSRFKATANKPVSMYASDFDLNGSFEQIICTFNGDTSYPMALKHDLVAQLPYLKKKYTRYEDYKHRTISDIFTTKQLDNAYSLKAYQLATSLLVNKGGKEFEMVPLNIQAQLSPVFAIGVSDYDSDGMEDVILGGNLYNVKPEVGRYDASYGIFLKGKGDGNFSTVMPLKSGMRLNGEIRDITNLDTSTGRYIIVARNNEALQIFGY